MTTTTDAAKQNTAKIGRPPAHDDGQIIGAGEALEAEGHKVTGFALRARLRGGDAKRLIGVWRKHKERAEATSENTVPMPLDFQENVQALSGNVAGEIEKLARKLFAHASHVAETRLTEERRQLADQRAELDAETEDAGNLVSDLDAKVAELETEVRRTQTAKADAEARVHKLDKELAVANARLSDGAETIALLRRERDLTVEHRDVWRDDADEAWAEVRRLQEANASLRERIAARDAACVCLTKTEQMARRGQSTDRTKGGNTTTSPNGRKEERKEERKEPAKAQPRHAGEQSNGHRTGTPASDGARRIIGGQEPRSV